MLKLTTATFSAVAFVAACVFAPDSVPLVGSAAKVAACVFAPDSVPLVGSAAKVATEFPLQERQPEKTQAFV